MFKFCKGDRVQMKISREHLNKGDVGVVVDMHDSTVGVEFKQYAGMGHDCSSNGKATTTDNMGWYVGDHEVVLIDAVQPIMKGGEKTVIYQVAVEKVTLATATVAEKAEVALMPTAMEARTAEEAILKIGIANSEALAKAKADYLKVTVKQFS